MQNGERSRLHVGRSPGLLFRPLPARPTMSNGAADTAPEGPPGVALPGRLMQGLARSPRYRLVRRLYHRHENLAPPLLFFGGVTWDALTLQRVGAVLDNTILGLYLVLLGGFIVLTLLDRNDRPPPSLQALSTWSIEATQFLAGGLFSAYVIYYTRSATCPRATPGWRPIGSRIESWAGGRMATGASRTSSTWSPVSGG